MPKIVIAAFDGLQPSQITPERMPIVSKLADRGVRFLHNHGVFPTVTRGNSASVVTGVTPGKHGLTANKSVFPEYSRTEVVDALIPKLPEINRLLDGKLLFVPTIGELISAHDLKWVSVVGGTSGNAFVQHPNAGDFGDVVIHPEFTNPPEHHATIIDKFGDWPAKVAPAADLVKRTADVAIEYAISELNPDVLLVWFPEPDTSQHAFGVDSPEAQEMYSLADTQLGRILGAIKSQGDTSDVFVVSDHGYSTIDSVIDVHGELANAGFDPSSVVIAENGGSVLLYLPDKNQELSARLLEWLIAQEWVGAVATDLPDPNNREYASIIELGMAGPRAPDIAIAMRSTITGNPAPLSRSGAAAGGKVGAGSHGGGSSAELHNTLIASGHSFIEGLRSELPSGNIDIAPTVLEVLGIPIPGHFDGRVLLE
ncbi:MAG: alkaline phosphatase family protein, partial [Dehalococcoidia bacterium]